MSDEEHLIENLIAYVQSVGWANVPNDVGSLDFHNVYKRYGNNGRIEVNRATFKWLLDMAEYVVYNATMGTDFSEELNEYNNSNSGNCTTEGK